MLDWLDATAHPHAAHGPVNPLARLWPAGLVLLGLLIGFVPLARLAFPPSTAPSTAASTPQSSAASTPASPLRALVAVGAGLVAGLVTGLVARDPVLRLAVGGYTAVVLLVFAAVALLVLGPRRPRWPGWPGWTVTLRTVLLAVYAGAMVAVPIQLGFTSVEPSLPRLLPLLLVGVSTWLLFAAAERVSGGRWYLQAAILAAGVFLLLVLTFTGFGPGFLLLVVPLLVALLAIGAGVAAVLRRRAVPPWHIALVAAPVLAWTVATTLPIS
jgi:hypothetical protein